MHIYVCIYTYISIYTYIYVHMYTYRCIRVCMHIFHQLYIQNLLFHHLYMKYQICIHISIYTYIYVHMYTYRCIRVCIRMYVFDKSNKMIVRDTLDKKKTTTVCVWSFLHFFSKTKFRITEIVSVVTRSQLKLRDLHVSHTLFMKSMLFMNRCLL